MRKKQFSDFSSQNSFGFWAKVFSDFWPKNVKNLSKLPSTRLRGTICGLKCFFESFKSFWIFCRNLWHGSQISIYVSRVKSAEETVFWFFFSEFFRILSETFFRLSAKKLQKVVETIFYVSRGTVCGLIFFSKVLNRYGFSAETFGMVLKFLCRCPE